MYSWLHLNSPNAVDTFFTSSRRSRRRNDCFAGLESLGDDLGDFSAEEKDGDTLFGDSVDESLVGVVLPAMVVDM